MSRQTKPPCKQKPRTASSILSAFGPGGGNACHGHALRKLTCLPPSCFKLHAFHTHILRSPGQVIFAFLAPHQLSRAHEVAHAAQKKYPASALVQCAAKPGNTHTLVPLPARRRRACPVWRCLGQYLLDQLETCTASAETVIRCFTKRNSFLRLACDFFVIGKHTESLLRRSGVPIRSRDVLRYAGVANACPRG